MCSRPSQTVWWDPISKQNKTLSIVVINYLPSICFWSSHYIFGWEIGPCGFRSTAASLSTGTQDTTIRIYYIPTVPNWAYLYFSSFFLLTNTIAPSILEYVFYSYTPLRVSLESKSTEESRSSNVFCLLHRAKLTSTVFLPQALPRLHTAESSY